MHADLGYEFIGGPITRGQGSPLQVARTQPGCRRRCLEEATLGRTADPGPRSCWRQCQMALCAVAEELQGRAEGALALASGKRGLPGPRTYAQTASPAQKQQQDTRVWLGNKPAGHRGRIAVAIP